ncbi:adenosylcobinamide-GDP ribazoletransferase [Flavobacterium columnare]|uniref:adenosylcobinamide-GDP ribazoletransferase n=1 Tax=Flavobacterium TaxID=237 RepID=UPI000B5B6255|nr:adenosylcobinamide-GDP ribazoletransferase [Flavobacterium columnare]OXA80504.1 adenosylcobinamide-GDP ribazoletransferase [Flavobacterium columnare NBRC 100251 = ATCC 23463]
MKKQRDIFFTALMFYTRIPCPKHIHHDPSYLNKATRYFPLVGWLVGSLSYLVFLGAHYLFSLLIAIIFSMVAGVLITGAFHEDGFADVCDGFGGGWKKEKILKIMKDSAIGAYGAIGVVLLLLIKFLLLFEIMNRIPNTSWNQYAYASFLFITYHSISRANAISLSFTLPYVREDELSKSKPIAKGFSKYEIIGVLFFGLAPLACMAYIYNPFYLVVLPILLLTRLYMGRYFTKWIGGYTGDCLGALEQISEVVTLLSFLTLCKFI